MLPWWLILQTYQKHPYNWQWPKSSKTSSPGIWNTGHLADLPGICLEQINIVVQTNAILLWQEMVHLTFNKSKADNPCHTSIPKNTVWLSDEGRTLGISQSVKAETLRKHTNHAAMKHIVITYNPPTIQRVDIFDVTPSGRSTCIDKCTMPVLFWYCPFWTYHLFTHSF